MLLVVLAAAGAGVWFGRRATRGTPRRRAPPATLPRPTVPPDLDARHPAPDRRSRPPRLLFGTPLLAGDHVRVRAPAAILVDARTGRVLWAKRAHERRKIASLTKIMTATLALREVPWEQQDHRQQVGHARAARARGAAHRRARQGVEALLRAAPLLRERRREPARDLERRLRPRVPAPDERRGAHARAPRHALHEPERNPRRAATTRRRGTSRR